MDRHSHPRRQAHLRGDARRGLGAPRVRRSRGHTPAATALSQQAVPRTRQGQGRAAAAAEPRRGVRRERPGGPLRVRAPAAAGEPAGRAPVVARDAPRPRRRAARGGRDPIAARRARRAVPGPHRGRRCGGRQQRGGRRRRRCQHQQRRLVVVPRHRGRGDPQARPLARRPRVLVLVYDRHRRRCVLPRAAQRCR